MKIYDSGNPLWTAQAVGAVVQFVQNPQGTPVPQIVLTGSTHITAALISAANRNALANTVSAAQIAANAAMGEGPWLATQYDTLTLAGVVATDTCVVNGLIYTCVASGATGQQFNVGATDADTATNLATVINSYMRLGYGPVFHLNNLKAVFQTVVSEITGSVSVAATTQIQVSNNGVDFSTHAGQAAQSPTGTGRAAVIGVQVDSYPFVRVNCTALTGTGARVQVYANAPSFDS